MDREDYMDPACPLCGKPGETEPARPIPVGRVLEKLDEYEQADDMAGAERHLLYWLAEAEQNRDLRGQLTLNNELMGMYRMSGKHEQALVRSEKAAELVARLGLEETITAGTTWLNSGTVRVAAGNPAEGLIFFRKAEDNYGRNLSPDDPRRGGLYNNMGLCLTALEKYPEASEAFRKALDITARKEHGETEQAITWLNLADALAAEKGPEDAEDEVNDCLDKAAELLDTPSLPQNAYYAFVCDKCAPVFGHYGYFLEEAELRRRVEEIRKGDGG